MAVNYISQNGYNKLKEKLEYLVSIKRKEITKSIEHARSFGDLKENAEYHAAKEEQAYNEKAIAELNEKLADSRIIDTRSIPEDTVSIGKSVLLYDEEFDEEIEYSLVAEAESDIAENKISITSPVGKALIGKKENDVVEIDIPAGKVVYKILKARLL